MIETFLERKRLEGLRPLSLTTYRTILKKWEQEGVHYLERLGEGKRAVAVAVINAYLKFCGLPPLDIKVRGEYLPERHHLTQEQIAKLLMLPPANKGKTGLKQKAFVLFLLDTGMRLHEALQVTLEQYDSARGALRVSGKGGKYRYVFVSPVTRLAISKYLAKAKITEGYLWQGRNEQLDRKTAYLMVKRELARVGVKHGHPHMLRHTFAIQFIKHGGDIRRLQQLLGHSNITTTARYLHFVEEELEDAHRSYGPLSKFSSLATESVS